MPVHFDRARRVKNDEFYTRLCDIEAELQHYDFAGMTVYCNCDHVGKSQFYYYFRANFHRLGLKRLIATHYVNKQLSMFAPRDIVQAVGIDVTADGYDLFLLKGDGDFRSAECVEFLKQADVVCTNPPFSLFREYVAQLVEYDKKFLIVGNMNAATYKEIFPLIQANRLWLGRKRMGQEMLFDVPESYAKWLVDNKKEGSGYKVIDGVIKGRASGIWFTNLPHRRRQEELILVENYTPEKYPKYDNYDAIEVSKVAGIPRAYAGAMGVPISFLDKHNPEQFEIIRFRKGDDGKDLRVNGKRLYARIVIKRRL